MIVKQVHVFTTSKFKNCFTEIASQINIVYEIRLNSACLGKMMNETTSDQEKPHCHFHQIKLFLKSTMKQF